MSKRVSILLPNETTAQEVTKPPLKRPTSRRDLENQILLPQYQTTGVVNNDSTLQSSTEDGRLSPKRIAKHPRRNRKLLEQDESNSQSIISKSSVKSTLKDSLNASQSQGSSKSNNAVMSSLTPTFTLVSTDEPYTKPDPVSEYKDPPNTPCDCTRFDKDCDCCHCEHMKLALRQVAFLESPEGQRRQEMKFVAKNFFMDICAMWHVRKQILNDLYGTQQDHPSSRVSYPVSLKSARILDSNSMIIEWYIHDHSDIDYYVIYVDKSLAKRIYNVKSTSTILIDLDPHKMHQLRMKAVPYKGRGSKADPMDKLVAQLCAGHMNNVMKDDFICKCDNPPEAIKSFYKKNKCKSLIDFWKDSEFLYMPTCRCAGTSDCECFMDQSKVRQQQQQAQPSECM